MEDEKKVLENEETKEDDFLKSLEDLVAGTDDEDEGEVEDTEEKEKAEEEQRQKNKNAEEARKRREKEAKEKKAEEEKKDNDKKDAQEQVKALVEKYPDLDLNELDKNEDFQDYLEGKWVKGGKTITQIYEGFIKLEAKLSKQDTEMVIAKHKKKSTPNLKGTSGNSGTNPSTDVYSKEELESLSAKIPFMRAKDFAKIEEKLNRSVEFYKKK